MRGEQSEHNKAAVGSFYEVLTAEELARNGVFPSPRFESKPAFCDTSTVAITQACYIQAARVDAVAAMRQLSAALKNSNCSPLCAPEKGRTVPCAVQ